MFAATVERVSYSSCRALRMEQPATKNKASETDSSSHIHSPLLEDKVDYGIELSCRPASLCSLTAGTTTLCHSQLYLSSQGLCNGPLVYGTLYAGVDYNITLCLLQSRPQYIYHGHWEMGNPMPESTITLCQSRLCPPVRD